MDEIDTIEPVFHPEYPNSIHGNLPQAEVTLTGAYPLLSDLPSDEPPLTMDAVKTKLAAMVDKRLSLAGFVPKGKFQNGVGACNIYTTGKIYQAGVKMAGGPNVDVSYASVYWALNRTNDPGQGTAPEDSLKYMLDKGIPLVSPQTPELTQRRFNLTPEQAKSALTQRFNEAYLLSRNDGGLSLCDALFKGFLVDGGIWWYDTDGYVAKDGRLPAVGKSIRSLTPGGHSVVFCGLKWFDEPGTMNAGGKTVQLESGLHIEINNHHGDDECPPFKYPDGATVSPRWGLNGNAYLPIARCTKGMQAFAWWALRDVFRFWGNLPAPGL